MGPPSLTGPAVFPTVRSPETSPDRVTLIARANTRSCVGVKSLMSVRGCVKVPEGVLLRHLNYVFSMCCGIIGRSFRDIFLWKCALVLKPHYPNILCSGQAQLLHRLPTTQRTLSAALAAATGQLPRDWLFFDQAGGSSSQRNPGRCSTIWAARANRCPPRGRPRSDSCARQ